MKDDRDKAKKQKAKATDTHQLQKLLDQMKENKEKLSGLCGNIFSLAYLEAW